MAENPNDVGTLAQIRGEAHNLLTSEEALAEIEKVFERLIWADLFNIKFSLEKLRCYCLVKIEKAADA